MNLGIWVRNGLSKYGGLRTGGGDEYTDCVLCVKRVCERESKKGEEKRKGKSKGREERYKTILYGEK